VFPYSAAGKARFDSRRHEVNPGVQVAVDVSGSGSGFKKLCAGSIDIADAHSCFDHEPGAR
jgi:ABC-type phosphate transport system substrate-binding protein